MRIEHTDVPEVIKPYVVVALDGRPVGRLGAFDKEEGYVETLTDEALADPMMMEDAVPVRVYGTVTVFLSREVEGVDIADFPWIDGMAP